MQWSCSFFRDRHQSLVTKGELSASQQAIETHPREFGCGLGKAVENMPRTASSREESKDGTETQHGLRMFTASAELSWCLASAREGQNSGLEPGSSFTWLQTESPLGFSPVMLRKLFFSLCNEAQISGSLHALCVQDILVRKLARPFPQAQLLFLGKQKGFWAELLVRQQIKERCPWGLQWEKYFRIQDAVSPRASFSMLCRSVGLTLLFNYSSNHLTHASFPTVNKRNFRLRFPFFFQVAE